MDHRLVLQPQETEHVHCQYITLCRKGFEMPKLPLYWYKMSVDGSAAGKAEMAGM